MLNLTRRGFLKGTSYLIAAAALPTIPFEGVRWTASGRLPLRIWADNKLIHDTISPNGFSIGGMVGRELFKVTEVSATGPRLIDFEDLPLQPFGNRMPKIDVEETLGKREEGYIIWADNIKETSETELLDNGGFATEYKYFGTWKVMFPNMKDGKISGFQLG